MNLSWLADPETLKSSSFGLQLAGAYTAGIITSFTPCVYPLIPLTLATVGAGAETSRRRAFLLALTYVAGIVFTFSTLGIVAARSGSFFGAILGRPAVILPLAILLLLLAAWTLDLFGSTFVQKFQNAAAKIGGKGYLGALLMGGVSGFVAAPCAGPPLIAILAIAAVSGQMLLGAALLAVYALGFGTLFIVIGTFSQSLSILPKSGGWLYGVKFLIAVALLMVALFILKPVLPEEILQFHGYAFFSLVFALGIISAVWSQRRQNRPILLVSAVLVATTLFPALFAAPQTTLVWYRSIAEGKELAARQNKILLVDFYADWCAGCLEYETETFLHPGVKKLLEEFVLVREDFTTPSPQTEELSAAYAIDGLPTIIFFLPGGAQIESARISGFLKPEPFVRKLEEVRQSRAAD